MGVKALSSRVIKALDPGIRDLVVAMRKLGYETTDSGDGVSKALIKSGHALPYPHVFSVVSEARNSTEPNPFDDARELKRWLVNTRKLNGWEVEVSFRTSNDPNQELIILAAIGPRSSVSS